MKRRRRSMWTVDTHEHYWWHYGTRKWVSRDVELAGHLTSMVRAHTKKKAMHLARSLLATTDCTVVRLDQWFYKKGVRYTRAWFMRKDPKLIAKAKERDRV